MANLRISQLATCLRYGLPVGTLATMKTAWRVAAVTGFLLGSAVATAQDPQSAPTTSQAAPQLTSAATPQPTTAATAQPTFRGGVDLVTVRAIVREARPQGFRMSSIVLGVVESEPFHMRMSR